MIVKGYCQFEREQRFKIESVTMLILNVMYLLEKKKIFTFEMTFCQINLRLGLKVHLSFKIYLDTYQQYIL